MMVKQAGKHHVKQSGPLRCLIVCLFKSVQFSFMFIAPFTINFDGKNKCGGLDTKE